jgi:hypothetical protein
MSQTTLALLVALVSVVAGTAPQIREALTPKSSDLKLSFRQVQSQNLEMAAWNRGHMSAQVQSARIAATTADGKQLEAIPLQIIGIPNVVAEQQALFGLQIEPALIPAFLDWPHAQIKSATLAVIVNEYKKPPETRTIDVPLDYFRLFCRATEDSDRLTRYTMQNALAGRQGAGQVADQPSQPSAAAAAALAQDARLTSKCVSPSN